MRRLYPIVMLLACMVNVHLLYAQDTLNLAGKVSSFPSRFFDKIQHKCADLDNGLTSQTEKYLQKLEKQENNLRRKLAKIDKAKAQQLFENAEGQYKKLSNIITQPLALPQTPFSGEYQPFADSIKTSLTFFAQNNEVLSASKSTKDKIQSSLSHVNQLQSKLRFSEEINAYIRQRKQQLKDALNGYSHLPKSVTRSFNNYKTQAYYYTAQVKEYRDAFNKEPEKLVKKGLTLLNKLPAYQEFIKQHGELAGFFNLPPTYENPGNLAGLQTKTQVVQMIQSQLSSAGSNGIQILQQNLQAGQAALSSLKDKVKQVGPGSGDMDMPDFKPNNQKTKSFWKRLEYGTNFQTSKNNFFPTTSDLGLSVGYKLNDKSTIGVGGSYKIGWGKDIKHITITHQGMGLRSFLDMKLKGSFFASGGFEYNYVPISADSLSSSSGMYWKDVSSWQQSGMIGISKIVSIKSKFFKKTKLQLLWDFLSYQQVPRAQPLIFRIGQLLK